MFSVTPSKVAGVKVAEGQISVAVKHAPFMDAERPVNNVTTSLLVAQIEDALDTTAIDGNGFTVTSKVALAAQRLPDV